MQLLYTERTVKIFWSRRNRFYHNVGNLDISKISENLSVAFGSEFRYETFEVIEGELGSYNGGGADSFAGNSPENSGNLLVITSVGMLL
jgi:iron complex outermembrane receptor protein